MFPVSCLIRIRAWEKALLGRTSNLEALAVWTEKKRFAWCQKKLKVFEGNFATTLLHFDRCWWFSDSGPKKSVAQQNDWSDLIKRRLQKNDVDDARERRTTRRRGPASHRRRPDSNQGLETLQELLAGILGHHSAGWNGHWRALVRFLSLF